MNSFYNDNGWLLKKNIFSKKEVDKILKLIDDYILNHEDKTNIWEINRTNDKKINSIHCLHIYDNTLLDFFKKKNELIDIVKILLNDQIEIIAIEAFLKPPLTGKKVVIHQDNYFWCLKKGNALTAWIALDEIDESNGCLKYYSKSNKLGLLSHEPSYSLGTSQTIKKEEYYKFKNCDIILNKLNPGDVQFHSSLTIHESEKNKSIKPRRVITVQFKSVNEKSDIIQKKKIIRFKCIIIRDYYKLTNKLGKKIFVELEDKEFNLIRKDVPIISINYENIEDWKFNEEDLIWCFCFRKYSKNQANSESDSLDLIEIEEEVINDNNIYKICCKFDNIADLKQFENSLFIQLGQYMIENKLITIQEYKEWFFKYHK